MSDAPTRRNRLDEAASPYLLEHADNPVNWQPWDEAALGAASERDVPIFLSIGYAACHWCHVMADESFDDDEVAAALNRDFVPIKVDREERPDLDRFYQTACQATGRGGGWPLSVWATPDGRPFQVATYLPKTAARGLPGLLDVLASIADAWSVDRETIEGRADDLTQAVRDSRTITPEVTLDRTSEGTLHRVASDLLRAVDHAHGGFQSAGPKFPQVPRLELLLRAHADSGRQAYRDALVSTLDAMIEGGLRDHVGGGFHRYVTDPAWRVPHFEKMAYDNAQLLGLLADAASRFENLRYAVAARETASFLGEGLGAPTGGIYCSLDADTAGEEGATYVWTPADLEAAIDDATTRALVAAYYGIEDRDDVAGGCVPRIQRSAEDLADAHGLATQEATDRLGRGVDRLRAVRQSRPQPHRDEKIIASWNGLAIAGFVRAGVALDDPSLLERANDILEFVDRELIEDTRLWRRYRDGDVAVSGFLEDYAAVAGGAFDLASATGSREALHSGLDLTEGLLERFWDADEPRLRFTEGRPTGPPADPLDARDRSLPSPIALAVDSLASASGFTDDERIASVIECVRTTHGQALDAGGVDQAALALAIDRWSNGPPSVTMAGEPAPDGWRRRLHGHHRRPTVTNRPRDVDAVSASLGLDAIPPLWRGREAVDGEPTLYACRGRTCGPPVHTVEAALDWFDEAST